MKMKMMKKIQNQKIKKNTFGRKVITVKKNTLNYVYPSILNNFYPFFSKKSNIYFSKLYVILKILVKFYLQKSIASAFFTKNINQYSEFSKDYFSKDLSKINDKFVLYKNLKKKNFFFNFNNPVCNTNTSLEVYEFVEADLLFPEYTSKVNLWIRFIPEYKNTYDIISIKN